jgi:VanZ family protein
LRILAVVLYVGFIFALSSWRNPPSGPELPYLDKVVHAVEYGILGLLLAWAAAGRGVRGWRRLGLVLAIGGAVAMADELYQRCTPGRESSPYDALADLAGLGLAGGMVEAKHQTRGARGGRE